MSKPNIFRLEFDCMPTYEERLRLEATLRGCGAHIQDFVYFYKRNQIRYRLSAEAYESFIAKFSITEYWNQCNVVCT